MVKIFISENNVKNAVEEFKKKEFTGTSALSFYLIFRHFGLSERTPVTIKGSIMSDKYKENYIDASMKMFFLTDPNETSEKFIAISPFNLKEVIKKSDLYNSGTDVTSSSIVSRPKDALKNIVRTVDFVKYSDSDVIATRETKSVIESCLEGQKISLKHFASWLFRFYAFDFESSTVNEVDFSRVVKKTIMNYLKLTKSDFMWLFEDDILNNSFTPSDKGITGTSLRNLLNFDEKAAELQQTISNVSVNDRMLVEEFYFLEKDKVEEYLKLLGDNPTEAMILDTLYLKRQIVLTGVPGTGKSRFLDSLKNNFYNFEMIQFHANYSYEDFIGGETLIDGTIESKAGIFLKFCKKAEKYSDEKFLFIIDELNRGNIAQIFGETILTLDRGYSVKLSQPITIKDEDTNSEEVIDQFSIPDNVYIAASMNSADRNIAFIDLAIRRRFAFIEIQPNYEVLSALAEYKTIDLGNVLQQINNSILKTLSKEELYLGQSYFLSDSVYNKATNKYIWNNETLQLQFNYVILPTLKEYSISNENALTTILGDELASRQLNTETFVEAFVNRFGNV